MTTNDFGNFGDEQQPKNIKEYTERANPILQQHGKKIVTKSMYDLLRYAIIGIILIGVLFGYAMMTGKFKSEISCPTCPNLPSIPECPTVTCPVIPSCPSCPSNNITSVCNFPTNLNLNISNHS